MSINSFRHKGLKQLWRNGSSKLVDSSFTDTAYELLQLLNAATGPRDLAGVNDFHPLKGGRKGEWSLHVNGPWVITFRFDGKDIVDVQLEQYH